MSGKETAEILALQALAWLLGQPGLAGDFLSATGADAAQLAARAGDPAFLGGVLDFLMEEDRRVLDFCREAGLDPQAPMRARAALPGGQQWHWT